MAKTPTLQQIHLLLKELSGGHRVLLCTKLLREQTQLSEDKLMQLLHELANLQYLKFTSSYDFVQLSETGLRGVPEENRRKAQEERA